MLLKRREDECKINQALEQACSFFGSRLALVFADGEGLTYEQLNNVISEVASFILPGKRILMRVRHCDQALIVFYAILRAGSIPYVGDPEWSLALGSSIAEGVGCDTLLHDDGSPITTVRMGEHGQLGFSLHSLSPVTVHLEDKTSFIRFTSGSSGMPKAVQFSSFAACEIANAWANAADITSGDRVLCLATVNNGLAFNTSLLPVFIRGAQLQLASSAKLPSAICKRAESLQPTIFVGFPNAYELMCRHRDTDLRRAFASTRLFLSSAAPLFDSVRQSWNEKLNYTIGNYYGLAETGPVTFNNGGDHDSLGHLLPGASVESDCETGQLTIRTPWMGLGYVQPSDSQSSSDWSKGYISQDVGAVQKDGHVVLKGRVDRVINIAGKKISPKDIESQLSGLLDGAWVLLVQTGAEEDRFLTLFVESDHLTSFEVMRLCGQILPAHAVPRVVRVSESLPRSAAGKILAAALP